MTMLDGLTIIVVTKTQYEHFGEKMSKFVQSLCTFGKASTMKVGKNGKVGNQKASKIFVRYVLDHGGFCYCMYNPGRGQINKANDVIWLEQVCFKKKLENPDAKALPEIVV